MSTVLVLNQREVRAPLDLDRLREALGPAMADLSAGRVSLSPRVAALVPQHDALLGVMPTYLPASETLATKLVSLFPGNAAAGRPSHQAVVVMFDAADGAPVAMMDGTALTAAARSGHDGIIMKIRRAVRLSVLRRGGQ